MADDLGELSALLKDPDVMRYSLHGVFDEAETRGFIEWCMACYCSHGFGPWAMVDRSSLELIGFCGIYPEKVEDVEEVGLGYRFHRRYWGQGLAGESCKAVLDFAFGNIGVSSVVAIIEAEHAASIRVAEKVGFDRFDTVEFGGRIVRRYRLGGDKERTEA